MDRFTGDDSDVYLDKPDQRGRRVQGDVRQENAVDDVAESRRSRRDHDRRFVHPAERHREGPVIRPDTVVFAGAVVGIVWPSLGLLIILAGGIYAISTLAMRFFTRLERRHRRRSVGDRDVHRRPRNLDSQDADE